MVSTTLDDKLPDGTSHDVDVAPTVGPNESDRSSVVAAGTSGSIPIPAASIEGRLHSMRRMHRPAIRGDLASCLVSRHRALRISRSDR